MSSEERIDALEEVCDVIASFNLLPIKQRKFNGIFNAMEIQIEDDDFSPEAVEHLGNAVIAVAKEYRSTRGMWKKPWRWYINASKGSDTCPAS